MKLIGSSLFVLIGALMGIVIGMVFRDNFPGFLPNIIIGILGSFAGLFFKDVFDIVFAGNLGGAVIFSALGALVFLLPTNLLYRRLFKL